MTDRLLLFCLLVMLILVLWWSTGRPSNEVRRPYGMSEFIYRLGVCETGLNFRHDSGEYEGFVGWYWGTWLLDRYKGMPSRAYLASPRQQIRVAYRSVARGRFFGCAEHSAWVRAAR